jgi:YHS domain-containing protein
MFLSKSWTSAKGEWHLPSKGATLMFTPVRRTVVLGMTLGAALAFGLSSVRAQDAPHDQAATTTQPAKAEYKGDPYLLTTDPVTSRPLGDKPVTYQHEGRELRFTDQKSLETFKADPAKYLPKVDRQMVQQQLPFYPLDTCMISGDKLGGDMGKPVDLIYRNRLVRFCCNDCVKDFQKEPAKYITKLNEAVIAKQRPGYPLTTCVVSGDKLGGDMGKPVDLVVGNRLVRFCCADCLKDFNKNPAKFLKMIDDAARKKSAASKPGSSDSPAKSPNTTVPAAHQH